MGTICIVLTVLITVFVLMVGQYNDTSLNISIMYTNLSYKISLLVLTLIVYAFGILSGVLLMLSSFFDAAGRYSRLKKEYDKTSDGADDKDDKIKVLENKIQTLETALQKAVDENKNVDENM